MKKTLAVLALALPLAATALAQTPAVHSGATGTLTLANNDRLQVRIESYDAAGDFWVVRHPFAKAPIEIAGSALARFVVPPTGTEPAAAPAGDWVVEMTGGDRVRASGLHMDGARIRAKNALVGEVTLPRAGIATLLRTASSQVYYEGPKADEEWLRQRNAFTTTGNSVESPQGQVTGRVFPVLPRRARIDMTVRSPFPMFMIGLYLQAPQGLMEGNAPGYQLHYQMGNNLILFRRTADGGAQQVGTVNMGQAGAATAARGIRLTVFTDLDKQRFLVHINNRPVADWTDGRAFQNPGAALSFMSHNSNITITNLRISDWDGIAPQGEKPRATGNADSVQLKNGDNLSGEVLAIAPTSITVRTPFGELAVPLENIERVDFKTAEAPAAASNPRFQLSDGSSLSARPLKFEKDFLICESATAGAVRIPIAALTQIHWPSAPARAEDGEEEPDEAPATGIRIRSSVLPAGGGNLQIIGGGGNLQIQIEAR